MGCLYCGKEIGPFRLLRDDEFCSSVHRKRYGERLGKALDRIIGPELVPTAIPGACKLWPVQDGFLGQAEGTWDFGYSEHPIQTGEFWPFTVTPTLGEKSRPLALEPVPMEDSDLWFSRPPQPLTISICLPPFEQSVQIGLPLLAATAAGKLEGMPPGAGRPKTKVLPLPSRGGALAKSRPDPEIYLPAAYASPLHTALPAVHAVALGKVQLGIPPAERHLRCLVLPMPVEPRPSVHLKTVERPYQPILRPFDRRMPGSPPEAAARRVLPAIAAALDAEVHAVLPEMDGCAIRVSNRALALNARWEHSPAAEPVAMMVLPRCTLAVAEMRAEAPAMALPSLAEFQPLRDMQLDFGAAAGLCVLPSDAIDPEAGQQDLIPISACPAQPGLAPVPVESLVSYQVALNSLAWPTEARALQLPSLDNTFTAPRLVDALKNWAWPAPAEIFIPPATVPEPVMAEPEALWLPPLPTPAALPVSLSLSGSRTTQLVPVASQEASSPSTDAIAPIADAPGIRLPAVSFAAEMSTIVADAAALGDVRPLAALPIPPATPPQLDAVTAEVPALRLPDVTLAGQLGGTLGMSETRSIHWPKATGASIPAAAAPDLDAVIPDVPALRLPGAMLTARLAAAMGMSENSPTLPGPVQSWIPAAATPEPVGLMTGTAAPHLPSLAMVGEPLPSMGKSEACPNWPKLAQSPAALTIQPMAASAQGLQPQLPGMTGAFAIPTLLNRLSAPRPVSSYGLTPADRLMLSGFTPVPVPIEPPAPVLSLPIPVKPGRGSEAAQVGPATKLANPVDSMPAIAAFAPFRITRAPEVQFPQVPAPQAGGLSTAGLDPSYPPYAAPEPGGLNPNAAVLNPMSLLRVNRLAIPTDRRDPAIPQPGFIPIEFYCQRGLVAPCQRLSWKSREMEPLWTGFSMRPLADRNDDPAPWRPAPKPPTNRDIPIVSDAAKSRARARMFERVLKIAACLVMGVFLWFGAHELRIASTRAMANRASAGTSLGMPGGANPLGAGSPAGAGQPQGLLADVKHAIGNRAAATVADNLQAGMESWGAPAKAWSPGWSRNPDGYVHPGELALFHPSAGYKDYRLEFFGQIENKSMGWAVRAKDKQNYYAMKFTVLENGLRPVIAMAHYPVVDGRKGRKVETPLSVMVHHNTAMHVAVDVQGNRVTASIEGQQVDSWTDDLLPAGGVGFFSDAGERARFYWMKVSKNQDWLGVICSYLSGDAGENTRDTAEVWGQGIPGDVPMPGRPVQPQDVALVEAETSGSDFSSPQRAKIWIQRRIRPWSS